MPRIKYALLKVHVHVREHVHVHLNLHVHAYEHAHVHIHANAHVHKYAHIFLKTILINLTLIYSSCKLNRVNLSFSSVWLTVFTQGAFLVSGKRSLLKTVFIVKEFENASLITWYNRSFAKTVTFNGHVILRASRAYSNIHQGLKQRSILKLSQFGVDGGKVFLRAELLTG